MRKPLRKDARAVDPLGATGGKRTLKAAKQDLRNARAAAKQKATRARDLPGGRVELLELELRDEIARLAKSRGPVLVGPFTGEVGFELLYWLPLVRWAVREFPALEGRLVVISRGGVSHWWQSFV